MCLPLKHLLRFSKESVDLGASSFPLLPLRFEVPYLKWIPRLSQKVCEPAPALVKVPLVVASVQFVKEAVFLRFVFFVLFRLGFRAETPLLELVPAGFLLVRFFRLSVRLATTTFRLLLIPVLILLTIELILLCCRPSIRVSILFILPLPVLSATVCKSTSIASLRLLLWLLLLASSFVILVFIMSASAIEIFISICVILLLLRWIVSPEVFELVLEKIWGALLLLVVARVKAVEIIWGLLVLVKVPCRPTSTLIKVTCMLIILLRTPTWCTWAWLVLWGGEGPTLCGWTSRRIWVVVSFS